MRLAREHVSPGPLQPKLCALEHSLARNRAERELPPANSLFARWFLNRARMFDSCRGHSQSLYASRFCTFRRPIWAGPVSPKCMSPERYGRLPPERAGFRVDRSTEIAHGTEGLDTAPNGHTFLPIA
jgi:hypothetical protein